MKYSDFHTTYFAEAILELLYLGGKGGQTYKKKSVFLMYTRILPKKERI